MKVSIILWEKMHKQIIQSVSFTTNVLFCSAVYKYLHMFRVFVWCRNKKKTFFSLYRGCNKQLFLLISLFYQWIDSFSFSWSFSVKCQTKSEKWPSYPPIAQVNILKCLLFVWPVVKSYSGTTWELKMKSIVSPIGKDIKSILLTISFTFLFFSFSCFSQGFFVSCL